MVIKKDKETDKLINEDLRGFEEVIDLYAHDKREKGRISDKNSDPFALFNFLERENQRLAKVDLFFREKSENYVSSKSLSQLVKIQQENLALSRSELINQLKGPYSPLMKNMKLLFNKSFTSKSK